MNLWLDDERHPMRAPTYGWPEGIDWTWCKTVNEAVVAITVADYFGACSLDHDLGNFAAGEMGGNGIDLVAYMIKNDTWPTILCVHSANPVGVKNMLSDIDRYGPYTKGYGIWRER